MLDIIILNRNLGDVCDALVSDLQARIRPNDEIIVVEAGSEPSRRSAHAAVVADDEETREMGLRFGRGMNLGLRYRDQNHLRNPWVLMLPVDAEIAEWRMDELLALVNEQPQLAAIKPTEPESAYRELLGAERLKAAWHLEEGPWLIRDAFIEEQRCRSPLGDFFDRSNFRGYLTSLELALRAYVNGSWVGVTDLVMFHENEALLVDRADLIRTEPADVNQRLLLEEGTAWLRAKYSIDEPWTFAQVVNLVHDRFMLEHPEMLPWRFEAEYAAH